MARKRLDGAVDKEWTTASVKMAAATKEAWRRLAEAEGRSMGNYLERLLNREAMEHEVTLYDVMGRLEVIHALLVVNGSKAPVKRKETTENLYEMNLTNDDGEEMISRETWTDWINHLRKLKKPPSHYTLSLHLEEIKEIFNQPQNWDCDKMIRKIIKSGHASIYLPKGDNW